MIERTARLVALAAVVGLSACATNSGSAEGPRTSSRSAGIEDEGGISGDLSALFGRGGSSKPVEQAGIGVNAFLWRATLDTLSFMPLDTADPYGGTVVTEWHAQPSQPNERFKAVVYILDTRLRADAVKVSLFKQVKQGEAWVDAAVDQATVLQVENAILTRARQLRLATIGG